MLFELKLTLEEEIKILSQGLKEDEIKSKSRFITDSVYEDGVSTAIENIILPLIMA